MFWFFGREACGILVPRSGIKPTTPALEGRFLTTGPPGRSLLTLCLHCLITCLSSSLKGEKVGTMGLFFHHCIPNAWHIKICNKWTRGLFLRPGLLFDGLRLLSSCKAMPAWPVTTRLLRSLLDSLLCEKPADVLGDCSSIPVQRSTCWGTEAHQPTAMALSHCRSNTSPSQTFR